MRKSIESSPRVGAKELRKEQTPSFGKRSGLETFLWKWGFRGYILYISLQKNERVVKMGLWDGLQWQWNLIWRRNLFQWEVEQFEALLECLQEVHLTKHSKDGNWWHFDTKDAFSVRSFVRAWWYQDHTKENKRLVWKGLAPPRAELLVWFIIQGKLNTRLKLFKLNQISASEASCPSVNWRRNRFIIFSFTVSSPGDYGQELWNGGTFLSPLAALVINGYSSGVNW